MRVLISCEFPNSIFYASMADKRFHASMNQIFSCEFENFKGLCEYQFYKSMRVWKMLILASMENYQTPASFSYESCEFGQSVSSCEFQSLSACEFGLFFRPCEFCIFQSACEFGTYLVPASLVLHFGSCEF